MNILALDTSDKVLSAALSVDNNYWYSEIDAGIKHSELLLECIDGLCGTAGIRKSDLNLVACAKGPGSFTGLRIGYSTAKGICLALGIPLIAVSTLDCLAYPLSILSELVLPVIDAKKKCFFASFYREGSRISEYLDVTPETLFKMADKLKQSPTETILLTGSGAEMLYSHLSNNFPGNSMRVHPSFKRGIAKELLEISKSSILDNISGKPLPANLWIEVSTAGSGPEYLRQSDAESNWI
ncbi:MAG: tRNA (adenosine(37)-N6)-threonylcarbamoyltransferase complex dimerization subunit type 1 TsaB [Treponema sp.]|jgi:tRNA threonylcarbamoyladenosine biosynthesis protein TsaB|nr:tRNA (adenosine(37)-N6)-threonylcarbamoyltransferase complex dimerization subunit type 1 TsaB [Treponema sp.]